MNNYDPLIHEIASYVVSDFSPSQYAIDNAAAALLDALGCALLSREVMKCTTLIGDDSEANCGEIRVIGGRRRVDPAKGAFNNSVLVRWLDFNDTFLGLEWGHPSDNLGAILSALMLSKKGPLAKDKDGVTISTLLDSMIRAYEIQGVLSLSYSLNASGYDHSTYVRISSTAVVTHILGGTIQEVQAAISQAFVDGMSLRCYRHSPNTGSRKSWAAPDASARGVTLALLTLAGEEGYPSALSTPKWGFQDTFCGGETITLAQPLGEYVIRNILFKIPYPCEYHAQSALEAAIALHDQVRDRIDEIDKIFIETHDSALKIISKTGPLNNEADRDHSLEYIVAVGLTKGSLTYRDYENESAKILDLDGIREKMVVSENLNFSLDYLDPTKRSVANAISVTFKDHTSTDRIEIQYPLGHPKRSKDTMMEIVKKFRQNAQGQLSNTKIDQVVELFNDKDALLSTSLATLFDMLEP